MASGAPSQQHASWQAKANTFFQKVGGPVNKLSAKLGAEAFWPTSLDKESDKAARIIRSFCIDGFMAENSGDDKLGTEKKNKNIEKIPAKVLRNARGVAIFTVMRAGLSWSGAGGSGVLVAKLPDGRWSAPSGILIHTMGWGFVAGADIYDCVAVINNEKGLQGFTRVRATIGAEVSAAVGPLGAGGTLDEDFLHAAPPLWTYTKSRGLYLGVQVDGTVIVERTSENERFYGIQKVRHSQILDGSVQPPPGSVDRLWQTLYAAEGIKHDPSVLPPASEPPPGDHQLDQPQAGSENEYNQFASMDEHMGRTS